MAKPEDAELLATLNALLIRDEGHRNLMTVPQLATRMSDWLRGDYQAVLFEELDVVVGYALFRREPEYVYLRQMFVRPDFRRRGIGRAALDWLSVNAWQGAPSLRIEVLIGNEVGQAFWRAMGFRDYSVTMEREPLAAFDFPAQSVPTVSTRVDDRAPMKSPPAADDDHVAAFPRERGVRIAPFDDAVHRREVEDLWKSVFGYEAAHNRPPLVIEKKLEVNDQLFFVAVADEAVVGTVMAGYDGHRGWIYSVAVASSHRGQGVGSRLVLHAERALIKRGCVKINLQILEDNEIVAAFYSSLGYCVERRISMGKRIPANIPTA